MLMTDIMKEEFKKIKKEIKIVYNEHKHNPNHDGDFYIELDDYNFTMNNLRRIERTFPRFKFEIERDNYMIKRLVFRRRNKFII